MSPGMSPQSTSHSLRNDEFEECFGPRNKKSKQDTSQEFMHLLNSGNIDGSFTGLFLY